MLTIIPDWQSMTALEILEYLQETVVERKPADASQPETAWATGARGLRDFGPVVWEQMVGAIRAMGLNETANQIVSGMDYGDPATLAMIDQLAGSNPAVFTPQRVTTLKSWGSLTRMRYQIHGYIDLPSVEQIETEVATESLREQARQRVASIQERRRKWDAVSALIRSEIESDQVSTLDAITQSLATKWSN